MYIPYFIHSEPARGKTGRILPHTGTCKEFLNRTPVVQEIRSKNPQKRSHETKLPLNNKRNNQSSKEAAQRMGKIFARYMADRRLVSGIYKELKNLLKNQENK